MKIKIEINEVELRQLVYHRIMSLAPDAKIRKDAIRILVKSQQNYKSEWEEAAFRATYEGDV